MGETAVTPNLRVYSYTASAWRWHSVSGGDQMADENMPFQALDLGHMVGLWEIVDLPDEGHVFDLNEIEAVAIGKFGDAAADMKDTLDLRAARLPKGAYVAVFFPHSEIPNEPNAPRSPRPAAD